MSQFIASPLQPREVGQAFPLVQLLLPGVDRRHWEQFARRFLRRSGRRGILTVRDRWGHIRGLAIFRREIDMAGPILDADPVLVVDLLDASEVALTLIRALELRAREIDCVEIRMNLAEGTERSWPMLAGTAHLETRRRLTAPVRRAAANRPDGEQIPA
ncbi:hypothetical protein GCM10011611_57570 [Aliidongia dinghuensis]|uniref:Uncharacterized protein n=1 Tax=Aliidongia dinghuensis TaxID=1867774 RepID=A0A8J2Z074_9PROT|nr:hypothetical protein [Aliidongia dinghuensis]GGF43649.1 hypothetical protein GCM10011611_57570 [Aliidongia dinghuensis]